MSRRLLHAAARENFLVFARLAFEALHPGVAFEDNWHISAVAAMLSEAEVSREVRQIVTMPPRSLKSFLISIAFTAYLLGKDPATRILCVTYGERLSAELSDGTLRLMQSEFYKSVFPATRLKSEKRFKLTTTQGGMRFATSLGGAMTGFGGDWVIVDDPMNASETYSEAARERAIRDFDRALSSRVNNETKSRFIVVMQRLHAADLAGHLLATGDWTELRLQAKATERIEIDVGRREFHVVEPGDLLHPARLPQHVLDRKLRQLGSVEFQAQFQQDPMPVDGLYVKRKWLTYYDVRPSREGGQIVLSLDTATKTNPANDYSVITIWLNKHGKHYLIDLWRGKLEYPDLRRHLLRVYDQHNADLALIEDQGNGAALLQELRRLGKTVIPCPTPGSKISRLVAALAPIEAGDMLLPRDAPWLGTFIAEMLSFPNGRHDDQVDTVSQYFAWVRGQPSSVEFSYDMMNVDKGPTAGSIADALIRRNWRR